MVESTLVRPDTAARGQEYSRSHPVIAGNCNALVAGPRFTLNLDGNHAVELSG